MTDGKLVNRVVVKKHGGSWNVPSDDNGPREEEEPDAVESEGNTVSLTPMPSNQGYLPAPVLLNNLVLIRDPVFVPAVDSGRVMDAQDIDRLHLETSVLKLGNNRTRMRQSSNNGGKDKGRTHATDNPVQRAARISTREDVLVHEQAPNEILVLPARTETSDLEEECSIIIQQTVNLGEEGVISSDTDVLRKKDF